jgi:hypothetical protein
MSILRSRLLYFAVLASIPLAAPAQTPQQIIQQVVDAEHDADLHDHSQWTYLEQSDKPHEHLVQWVATTPQGDVQRVLIRNGQKLPEDQQRGMIQKFMHDSHAQKKQLNELAHDNQQIDDLLKLLPAAFVWTQTGSNETSTTLHFEPAPAFHPPTREARVFSSMAGDLVADNTQHRVLSIHGHLMREVTFGGGLLGKLKEGSTFSLEQSQVGTSLWQLTAIHVHLVGSALLFKSVSLEEDDLRSQFEQEPATVTLDNAATGVMSRPLSAQATAP